MEQMQKGDELDTNTLSEFSNYSFSEISLIIMVIVSLKGNEKTYKIRDKISLNRLKNNISITSDYILTEVVINTSKHGYLSVRDSKNGEEWTEYNNFKTDKSTTLGSMFDEEGIYPLILVYMEKEYYSDMLNQAITSAHGRT
eukprot:GHVP01002940.1.p1 GENE.GHVP01002940.1~~GHVP01002940.1.p1  ORF type:complete len:164 (+),score=10.92 GHVP01002940.1:68-493(+)